MELVRGLHNIRERHRGCVLTIGKFDGVHLGHQAVLGNLVKQARAMGLPATVMVFEPQPEEVFSPAQAPARLSRLRDKYELLRAQGVDRLLCIRFDQAFAGQSADFFIQDLLVKQLGVRFLVVGDDFRFGKGRQGDFAMLEAAGRQSDFTVVSTDSFRLADCRISSTAIRGALARDQFSVAEDMLGRPFSINGKVVHGDKKGRTIGFPTANVLLKRCKTPVHGVFAVNVHLDGQRWPGVANIGTRPTVHGQRAQLEVHVFGYQGDLYGRRIAVTFSAKLRDEQSFASFEALREQIEKDATQARQILGIA
ncbi:bifunctional riboflavin kinase/FAD synthetase [Aestuariibacter halophilus]|uniref:Riboflavin biosynthesis protein n=1 Tax=Fluctibacter halophilus TaxID=226011 RepID=A0ABS8G2C2_9ALTE|nr:bifunctional riboflavin kinase/FAD synthetase [Aestuariibacter halophilus]MCC2614644.1 bifunctional riboflavin kinase/FAD synthetase [Aestuariibacter halophilus]